MNNWKVTIKDDETYHSIAFTLPVGDEEMMDAFMQSFEYIASLSENPLSVKYSLVEADK